MSPNSIRTKRKDPSWSMFVLVLLCVPAVVVGALAASLMALLLAPMNLFGRRRPRRRLPSLPAQGASARYERAADPVL